MEFESVEKDLMGRIGRLKTRHGVVETPAVLPVVNPNLITEEGAITPRELYERFGFRMIITNSYIILKSENLKEKALERGLHSMLDFPGAIMTDSGTFQSYVYGDVDVDPERIVEFQRLIGSDIGTILDVFTTPKATRGEAEEALKTTLKRAKDSKKIAGEMTLAVPLQGGIYTDLRERAALDVTALGAEYVPVGGVVPLMESYRYRELFEILFHVQRGLTRGVPVHLFGAGHPSVIPFAVALGMDLFDSASYVKYARDGRYFTEYSTRSVEVLEELPCNCPVCSNTDAKELREMPQKEREALLSRHNLYVIQRVIKEVKQAIREGTLWEMLERYGRAHPKLWKAFLLIGERWEDVEQLDPLYKKRLFLVSKVSQGQPVFRRAIKRLMERYQPVGGPEGLLIKELGSFTKYLGKGYEDKEILLPSPYGPLPAHLFEVFPFGQTVSEDSFDEGEILSKYSSLERVEKAPEGGDWTWWDIRFLWGGVQMQFGGDVPEALWGSPEEAMKDVKVVRSKKTSRSRSVQYRGKHYFGVRASEGTFTLSWFSARALLDRFEPPRFRVVVSEEAAPYNAEGRSVFPRFVVDIDPELRPGDEVIVVDKDDNPLALGRLLLSPREVGEMRYGVAVKVREGVKSRER